MELLDEKCASHLPDEPQGDAHRGWPRFRRSVRAERTVRCRSIHPATASMKLVGLEFHIAKNGWHRLRPRTAAFPEDCIRSEILRHAFARMPVFPDTRTVLNIGGQDTKGHQVDQYGLVTSFQMNDRCAAGCGRYQIRSPMRWASR
ncbi:MAG: hypothetical protein IPI95_04560 [Flavobacteriales bacterium]|nr:hypothetical protein [Flavobacteriales bacterium]